MPSRDQRATQEADAKRRNVKSRDLRTRLRVLTETIKNDGEDLADHTKNLLTDRVKELDQLSRQVERPSEQADDSEAFYALTLRGSEMAKRMAAGKGRSANDFIRHLRAMFVEGLTPQQDLAAQPDAFNWKRLARTVNPYFRHAPGASCLLGPMDKVMKARKQIQRQQRKAVGKAVAPEILQAEDAEAREKRETERNMETMWSALKSHTNGIGILELTMNHQSFAQFAENNFTLSFLVHNKRARIAESPNNNSNGLLVFPHSERIAQKEGRPTAQNKDRSQCVLAFTMSEWSDWRRFVRPEDCLMPHRQQHVVEAEAAVEARSEDEAEDGGDAPASETQRRRKSGGRARGRIQAVEDEDPEVDSEEEMLIKTVTQHRKRLRKSGEN